LPLVELIDKPRRAIERGRSNPRLGIAVIAGVLLLIAWIAWAVYVTSDRGANAGLGVVLGWPALVAGLALIAMPFVGLYLLVNRLSSSDEGADAAPISGGAGDAEAETEEDPAAEAADEDEEPDEDEAPDEEADEGEADEDEETSEDEREETDPDEEPPSGEKATSVSG
jgi:hypothetical protein